MLISDVAEMLALFGGQGKVRSLERIGIESGIELPPLIPAATTVLDPRKDSERGLQQWREAWWWVSVGNTRR